MYNGHCRSLSAQEKTALLESGRRPAWRLKVPAEVISFVDGNFGPQQQKLESECGDFILRRSDGVYAYQLAVTADDGAMGITRVVRGWDLLSSTPRQIWLLEQLGYPVPTYCHLPLLVSPDGRAAEQAGPGFGRGRAPAENHAGGRHRLSRPRRRSAGQAGAGTSP